MKRLFGVVALFAWSVAGVAFAQAQAPAPCPANATALADGAKLKCTCDATASGGVYGSTRYTADSSICLAAKHAGKPPGPVDVIVGGACPSFVGSAANGVTTASWAAYDKTFSFGDTIAACAATASAPPPATAPSAATAPAPRPPAAPAGPSPLAAWEARAKTYAAALPEPLAGWQAQPLQTSVSNSAMAGREVTAYRIYRIGSHPAGLNSVTISISNNPDGTARYPIELWNSEAKRKEADWTMLKLAGRDALEGKSAGGTASETMRTLYFLTRNNLFVSVTWQEPHMTRDKALEYVKALDFARIEALASK